MSRSSGRVILVCGSRAWMDGAATRLEVVA